MEVLKEYITMLVEGFVDNYEVDFKDEVYNITLIVDMTDRGHLTGLEPLLCKTGKSELERLVKRYLPDGLCTVSTKVVNRSMKEVNISFNQLSSYVDINDTQPLNNYHIGVDPCLDNNDGRYIISVD